MDLDLLFGAITCKCVDFLHIGSKLGRVFIAYLSHRSRRIDVKQVSYVRMICRTQLLLCTCTWNLGVCACFLHFSRKIARKERGEGRDVVFR